jgi:hypothetical protein
MGENALNWQQSNTATLRIQEKTLNTTRSLTIRAEKKYLLGGDPEKMTTRLLNSFGSIWRRWIWESKAKDWR